MEHAADTLPWLLGYLRPRYYLMVLTSFHIDSILVPACRHRAREVGLPTRTEEPPEWHRVGEGQPLTWQREE